MLIGFLSLVSGFLIYHRRWDLLTPFLVTVAGGALLCEWLKFWVERPRPSALPFVSIGNSLPSGHVFNALITFGGASYYVSRATNRSRRCFGVSLLLTAIFTGTIAVQRLYFSHHWLTDIVASFFLGMGWLLLTCATLRPNIPVKLLVTFMLTLGISFSLIWHIPEIQLKLPSALNFREEPLARADFRPEAYQPTNVDERPEIDAVWNLPVRRLSVKDTSIDVSLPGYHDYLFSFSISLGRGATKNPCHTVDVLVNDHNVKTIMLLDGWREYSILVHRSFIEDGSNRISFRLNGHQKIPAWLMYVEARRR